jgi:hypothetical protein
LTRMGKRIARDTGRPMTLTLTLSQRARELKNNAKD